MISGIFIQIDYEGKTYYLSNGAFTKEYVYYPYLYAVPQIGIGGEGFAKVTTGQVSLIRVDDDLYHPFSGERYYSLISKPQEIPFRMYFENEEAPIFVGNLTLSEVTEDELRFMVVEETFEKNLIYPVIDREGKIEIANFYLFAPSGETNAANWRILCSSAAGGMPSSQTEVIIERTYSHEALKNELDPFLKLDYENYRDNRFLVGVGSERPKRIMLTDPEDQSQFITVNYLLNYIRYAQTSQSSKVYLDVGQILTGMGFTNPTKTTDADGNETWSVDDSPLSNSYQGTSRPDKDGNTIPLYSYAEMMSGTDSGDELYKILYQPDSVYYLGKPVNNPFSFGNITLRSPVVPFGDRKIKRNYTNYNENANNYDYHPQSVQGQIYKSEDLVIYAADAGQDYVQEKPSVETVTWKEESTGTATITSLQIKDLHSGLWVGFQQNVAFNKLRFQLSGTTGTSNNGTYYGKDAAMPSSNDARWEEISFSFSNGDVTSGAKWVEAGIAEATWYRSESAGSGTYWRWTAGKEEDIETKTYTRASGQTYWKREVMLSDNDIESETVTVYWGGALLGPSSWIGVWDRTEAIGADGYTYRRTGVPQNTFTKHVNSLDGFYDADKTYWFYEERTVATTLQISDVWTHGWNFSQVVSGGPKFWRKWKPFSIPAGNTWEYRIYDNGVQIESFQSTSDNVTTSPKGHKRGSEIGRIGIYLTTFYYYRDNAGDYSKYDTSKKQYRSRLRWEGTDLVTHDWADTHTTIYTGVDVAWKKGIKVRDFWRVTSKGDGSTKFGVGFKITNGEEYYTVERYKMINSSTGSLSFIRSGSNKGTWDNESGDSWSQSTTLTEGSRTYSIAKGDEVTSDAVSDSSGVTRYWKVEASYPTPEGYVADGTLTGLFGHYHNRVNSVSYSGGYYEMFTPSSNTYMSTTNTAISGNVTGMHNKKNSSWSTAIAGVNRIQKTEEYTYEAARERIYKRSIEEKDGIINGKGYLSGAERDTAYGTGWSDGRKMTDGEGQYRLSQVYIEGGSVYESTESTVINLGSSPNFIDGTKKNLPQHLILSSVTQAALMSTHGLKSDFYRLYRNDSKFDEAKSLAVIRFPKKGTVNEPTTTTYSENGVTYYSTEVVCHGLDLKYDSDLMSVYMTLECYVGTVIHNIVFKDSADNNIVVEDGDYPDGLIANRISSYNQYPLPKNTQKIIFTVRNDEDKMDSYSKLMRGFDLYIYQRFYPEIGSSSSSESQYAISFCLEFFNLLRTNGTHWQTRYTASHFMDLFHSSGGAAWEFLTDEVDVYAIRNPGLKTGEIPEYYPDTLQKKWTPRVFDNGVEIGLQLDKDEPALSRVYATNSDELFIHISHNPFGELAVTGSSINGLNLMDFYRYIAIKLKEEKDDEKNQGELAPISFSLDVDFSMTDPDLVDGVMAKNLPIYQDGEITIFEMAEKVAKATNQQFFFNYSVDDNMNIERKIYVVDLNYVFLHSPIQRQINQNEIVSFSIEFPYPIKAFESTLSRNYSYKATFSQNFESLMKRIDTTYRVAGTGVGNVKSFDVFAESFDEGRYWLKRFSETEIQPISRLEYNGIDRLVSIGKKVGFTDEFRQIQGFLIVQEIQYNFENESTIVSGISKFEEIIFS